MDTSARGGSAVAVSDLHRGHLGENGTGLQIRKPRSTRTTPSHIWHGDAKLAAWLIVTVLFLEERSIQNAHGATTTPSEAVATPSDHGLDSNTARTDDNTAVATDAEYRIPQGSGTMRGALWSTLPMLRLVSFPSQKAPGYTAGAERAVRRRRGGMPKQGGLHTDNKQGGAEQTLEEPRDAGAEDEQRAQGLEELQAQCTQLNLDCSWAHRLVSQHLRKNAITWTATTREAVSTALKKIADLVRETEHLHAGEDESSPTHLQHQRKRLTLEAQHVLAEHVVQTQQSASVSNNIHGSAPLGERAAEGAQVTNDHFAVEATEEESKVKTVETGHASSPGTADGVTRDTTVEFESGLLDTADKGKFHGEQVGPETGKVPRYNNVDADEVNVPLSEATESLTQNKALQHLVVLPLGREADGAVVKDDGPTVTEGDAEDHPQTTVSRENESGYEDVEDTETESESVDVSTGSESNEERKNNITTLSTNNESPEVNHPKHPLLNRPHHTVDFLTRPAENAPELHGMNARRALTIGQLETLLQSRGRESHHRHSPSRPLIFPSCYFDAPLQKRMRNKASVLAASLEQLNDAVEALAELGVLVEKQADVVEKAAFTLVYRDRIVGEPVPSRKPLIPDDVEKEEKKSETDTEQNTGDAAEPLTQTGNIGNPTLTVRASPSEREGSTAPEEKAPPSVSESLQTAATKTAPAEGQSHPVDEGKYRKLVGVNGVRKQLRELFASWELARRAAGASEMANEIMRRAATLRRGFVLPLQQDLQQLNYVEATLSPNHVALQRLMGCRGFISAVRRTVSRAEEDLYNLGAHAFASEVSLPLMAHDLQSHLADLLEHVVELQLQHHRALHIRAASLISLHREFFRSARSLQQEATARLKDSHPLIGTSSEEWDEISRRLSAGVHSLRADLATQLVALRTVDKKAARLEGILNLLQGGLEHLLYVEMQLQQIRRHTRVGYYWPMVDEEEVNDETRAPHDASGNPAEELTNRQVAPEKGEDTDAAGMKWRNVQLEVLQSPGRNALAHLQARVADDTEEALTLELPPKIEEGSLIYENKDLVGEATDDDGQRATKILQRLLGGVIQMAEFLQMYKQQSRDAEHLLRTRFHVAEESVQKAIGVAQAVTADPVALGLNQQEQRLRGKLPAWAGSIQRRVRMNARAEDESKDTAALVRRINKQARYLDGSQHDFENPWIEDNFDTGRAVVARFDRANSRLFMEGRPKLASRSAVANPSGIWTKKLPLPGNALQESQEG